ncbi:MAG: R3H domain-containing nucleic acid-binding protein [Kineosporiaceae bacterium]
MSDTTATEQQTHDGVSSEAPDIEDAGSGTPAETGVQPTPVSEADVAAPVDVDAEADEDSDEEADAEAEADEEADEEADGEGQAGSSRGRRSRPSLRRLEEEGEVAADYLEELLDIVDLDGDIDIDVENGRASVAIVAEEGSERDLRRLVGSRGEVLEALQELSRLAVHARTGERSRLMLDVAGFRAARRRKLEDIAARVCQDVKRTGEAVRLEPMTAFERKVVHDVVADAGLVSESEGEDPGRRVVVHPAGV